MSRRSREATESRPTAVYFVLVLLFVSSFALPTLTSSTVASGAIGEGSSQYDNVLIVQRGAMQASIEAKTTVDDAPHPHDRLATIHDEGSRGTDGLHAIRADELHEQGITGEGVRVGVIGSAFDADSAAIADNVAARHAGSGQQATNSAAHDTAVAEVVTRTTPDADLYLAGIGSEPTPDSYADAVDWLVEQEVDVIVDSGSYFAPTTGDMDEISAAAERASDEGVVFVTSAGNYADRHWSGVDDGEEWVSFAPDAEVNALNEGQPMSGRVSLSLYWNTSADYDLYLYRSVGNNRNNPVVAKSVTRQADENASSVESIDVAVPRGVYYVSIYAHDGPNISTETNATNATLVADGPTESSQSEPVNQSNESAHSAHGVQSNESERVNQSNQSNQTTDSIQANQADQTNQVSQANQTNRTRLRLFSPQNTLTHRTAAGSMVAPATSERVITVGAIDAKSGELRAYSSRDDAGAGADIDAPDGVATTTVGTFYGTSAAAPYVAGSVALIESSQGELSSAQIEQLLAETAHDTGNGRQLDAYAAVQAAKAVRATNEDEAAETSEMSSTNETVSVPETVSLPATTVQA